MKKYQILMLSWLLLSACTQDESLVQQKEVQSQVSELNIFNSESYEVLKNVINRSLFTKGIGASDFSSGSESELANIVSSFLSKNKAVLDNDPYYKTQVSSDFAAGLKSDPSAYLEFVRSNGSNKYYEIIKGIVENGKTIELMSNEIINSKQMAIEEKVTLLLQLSVDKINNDDSFITKSASSCYSEFKSERSSCGFWFGIECAASFTGGPLGAAIGVVLATRSLNGCLNDAREDYIRCLE